MLKLVKRYLLGCLIVLGVAGGLASCDSDPLIGPTGFDPDNYPCYFINSRGSILFSYEGESRELTAYGLKEEDGIAVVYISPRYIANWEDILNFMGENPVFDVGEYCRELGYDSYPNTPDFFVRYKWMEINTVKILGERDGVVTVKVDANPYKESRTLWILFRNQKSQVLEVSQDGNPKGI